MSSWSGMESVVAGDSPVWFRRLADAPGVGYTAPAGLNLSRLKKGNVRPEVTRYSGLPPSLVWGDSGQSPAAEHARLDEKASTNVILRRLAETLELPGEPSDYHFAIQSVIVRLHMRRREGPQIFAELERLCWTDIRLADAYPEAVSYDQPEGTRQFYDVGAIRTLLDMYMSEGLLDDAARVLPIAGRCGMGDNAWAQRVRERLAAISAEDAP